MTVSVREVGADEVERLSQLTVDAFVGLPDAVYEEGYLEELADVARRADEAVVLVAVDDENGDAARWDHLRRHAGALVERRSRR